VDYIQIIVIIYQDKFSCCVVYLLLLLSPAHYLIGKPLTTIPEGDLTNVSANRLSTWQHISKVRQDFWTRWNLEYLNDKQLRRIWHVKLIL